MSRKITRLNHGGEPLGDTGNSWQEVDLWLVSKRCVPRAQVPTFCPFQYLAEGFKDATTPGTDSIISCFTGSERNPVEDTENACANVSPERSRDLDQD